MEKFFNDIQTFIGNMNVYLRISIIALFAILDILVLRDFIKSLCKEKIKIKILDILLLIIISGILVLVSIYSF